MSIVATPHEGPSTGEPAPAGFQKRLGLFDATMLVAGSMIGSGIFIVSAEIARDVGSSGWLLAVWLVTGVMTVIGALSYAELAAMMPHAGGQYIYLREAYSPLWGFLYGWTLFLVIQTGTIAAVGVAFAKFLGAIVPPLGTDPKAGAWVLLDLPHFQITAGQCVGVAVVLLLTAVNCLGVREGKWVQNLFTVAKTLALILLIVLGLSVARNPQVIAENLRDWWSGIYGTGKFMDLSKLVPFGGLAALMIAGGAMVGSLFSSDAWNNVTFTAGEVINTRRNLPLSLALGTGMVTLLYLLANVAYLCDLPLQGDEPLARKLKAEIDVRTAQADELAAEGRLLEVQAARLNAEAENRKATAAQLKARGAADQGEDSLEIVVAGLEQDAKMKTAEAASRKNKACDRATEAEVLRASTKQWAEEQYFRAAPRLGISHARDDRVGTAVMELVSPGFGVQAMALAIMISTFGCANGLILMGARLYYAMAKDGLFFQSVGRLNRFGVPAVGLILQAVWASLLTFSGKYGDLLNFVIFAALLFYVLTVVGLFVLRRKRPDADRPYKAVGYPVLPAIYVVLCALIMVDLLVVSPAYTWPGLIIVLTGVPAYFLWRWLGRAAWSGDRAATKLE
jgi:amino acid transporter